MSVTSGRGNALRAELKQIEFQTAVEHCLIWENMWQILDRFYFVREHDGYSIGYRMTVVELACLEWSTPQHWLVDTQVQGFDMERTSLHLPIECTQECLEACYIK